MEGREQSDCFHSSDTFFPALLYSLKECLDPRVTLSVSSQVESVDRGWLEAGDHGMKVPLNLYTAPETCCCA